LVGGQGRRIGEAEAEGDALPDVVHALQERLGPGLSRAAREQGGKVNVSRIPGL
jgi:hypothetical protein